MRTALHQIAHQWPCTSRTANTENCSVQRFAHLVLASSPRPGTAVAKNRVSQGVSRAALVPSAPSHTWPFGARYASQRPSPIPKASGTPGPPPSWPGQRMRPEWVLNWPTPSGRGNPSSQQASRHCHHGLPEMRPRQFPSGDCGQAHTPRVRQRVPVCPVLSFRRRWWSSHRQEGGLGLRRQEGRAGSAG